MQIYKHVISKILEKGALVNFLHYCTREGSRSIKTDFTKMQTKLIELHGRFKTTLVLA